MIAAIGSRSTPKGGFGNRLLNYIKLRELSRHLGVPWFCPNRLDTSLIKHIHRPLRVPQRLARTVFVDRASVLDDRFLERAREILGSRRTVVMKPRLLTEALARFDFIEPRALVKHRFSVCHAHRRVASDDVPVVLHLRGTDFAQWQPGAVYGEPFYQDGLDFLSQTGFGDAPVRISTDDPHHPALPGLVKTLSSSNRLLNAECDNPFVCDFAALMRAQRVVSSPSTFAITAGLLGDGAALHSRAWVESRIEHGDLFWQKVRDNSVKGYRVVGEV